MTETLNHIFQNIPGPVLVIVAVIIANVNENKKKQGYLSQYLS